MTLGRFRAVFLILSAPVLCTLALASSDAAQTVAKPGTAEDHIKRGGDLASKDDFDGAIAEYRQAIRLNPQDASAHNELGWALNKEGNLDGAIAEFREALRLNPKDGAAHTNLGWTLASKGDLDGAIAEFREALRLNPKSPFVHITLGRALGLKHNWDGATAEFREALRLDPKNADAHSYLGLALENEDDWDGAINEEREALRLNPADAKAHSHLGFALEIKGDLRGDLRGALREYRISHSLDPEVTPSPLLRFWELAPRYVRLLIILLSIAGAFAFRKVLHLALRRRKDAPAMKSRFPFAMFLVVAIAVVVAPRAVSEAPRKTTRNVWGKAGVRGKRNQTPPRHITSYPNELSF